MQAPQLITAINVTESVTTTSYTFQTQNVDRLSIQANAIDAAPAAKSFVAADVDADENTITITDHGFVTGLKIALSGTNLPGGLSATNYWAIVIDADTIKVADSLAHAVAGTNIDITNAGTTDDAEFTPASLGSSTVELKCSLDGVNYFSFATPKTITITETGNQYLDCGAVTYPWAELVWTAPTTGALTLAVLAYGCNTKVQL